MTQHDTITHYRSQDVNGFKIFYGNDVGRE